MTSLTAAGDRVAEPVWDSGRSRARRCKRWSTQPADVLDLGVAEMDVSACPPVFDAVRAAVSAEAFGYPLPDAHSDAPAAAAAWLSGQGLGVGAEDVRLVPDVMRGMTVAIRRLTAPGSPILIPTPAYTRFFEAVALADRQAVHVPMRNGHRLDLDGLRRGLMAGAGAVLLCNPVNPLGVVFDREQLAELALVADRWGARVISNEVHAPIRYGVPFTPYAALSEVSRAHAVTVTTATKAWNFPGLRTAFVAFTAPGDMQVWGGLPHLETSGMSPLGMVATTAALTHGRPWLDAVLRHLDGARHTVQEHLRAADLGEVFRLPDATYFAWLDLRAWGEPAAAAWLRERAGVVLGEGADYGPESAGFVRLNFATAPDALAEALERICTVLRHQQAHTTVARSGGGGTGTARLPVTCG